MLRRTIPALSTLLLILLLPVLPLREVVHAQPSARPNIILIVTDDQAFHELAQMPKTRALLEQQGTSFANFLVSTPGCCPSRASILRGQYTRNHGTLTNDGPNGGYQHFRELGRERSTIATWLQDAGYRTALIGKYLNGYGEENATTRVPPGWDEWAATTSLQYFDYDLAENGRLVHYGTKSKHYLTDVLSQKARAFVTDAVQRNRPFFLYLTPKAPHGPATPAPRHKKLFSGLKAPRTAAFNEGDVGDKPAYVRQSRPLNRDEVRQIDALYRDRLRSLQCVDEMIGKLFQTLDETGELDETYVFFTSDNGYLLGEHRRTEKGMPYEEAIRVPLLVRGPGVASRTVDDLATNVDLVPTIAELTGVAAPDFVDGRSLVPLLEGRSPNDWRQAVLVEAFDRDEDVGIAAKLEIDNGPPNPPFKALRLRDRVYVEYRETGERELYDLAADPMQLENLAATTSPAELDRLHAWLEAMLACQGAECRVADAAPPGS